LLIKINLEQLRFYLKVWYLCRSRW